MGLPAQRRELGEAEIDEASKIGPITDRERRYVAALGNFLHADQMQKLAATQQYSVDLGALSRAYPQDVEAQAFHGLALSEYALLDSKNIIEDDRKALAILLPGFRTHPDHPGFAHYIIHTCDNPQLAREALPAAEKYAAIAPASAHALHMPGHIFARLGMWHKI